MEEPTPNADQIETAMPVNEERVEVAAHLRALRGAMVLLPIYAVILLQENRPDPLTLGGWAFGLLVFGGSSAFMYRGGREIAKRPTRERARRGELTVDETNADERKIALYGVALAIVWGLLTLGLQELRDGRLPLWEQALVLLALIPTVVLVTFPAVRARLHFRRSPAG